MLCGEGHDSSIQWLKMWNQTSYWIREPSSLWLYLHPFWTKTRFQSKFLHQNHITHTCHQKDSPHWNLTKEETSFDDALGKLNWLTGMTRTEISFEVCQINTRVKNPIVAGILPVNKVMKSTSNSIGIPNLNLKSLSLQMQTLTTYHKG